MVVSKRDILRYELHIRDIKIKQVKTEPVTSVEILRLRQRVRRMMKEKGIDENNKRKEADRLCLERRRYKVRGTLK